MLEKLKQEEQSGGKVSFNWEEERKVHFENRGMNLGRQKKNKGNYGVEKIGKEKKGNDEGRLESQNLTNGMERLKREYLKKG